MFRGAGVVFDDFVEELVGGIAVRLLTSAGDLCLLLDGVLSVIDESLRGIPNALSELCRTVLQIDCALVLDGAGHLAHQVGKD